MGPSNRVGWLDAVRKEKQNMNSRSGSSRIRVLHVAFFLVSMTAPVALAQMAATTGQQASPVSSGADSLQNQLHMLTDVQTQGQGIDSKELADYKAFYKENQEPAKKIQLGNAFLQKYPNSALREPVEAALVMAYVDRQDWANVYSTADRALALKPDDVDVLTTVGWVIPHVYQPDDPDASSLLGKAETYEKHALEVMGTMPKPHSLTDGQFTALKAQKSLQAHSALGLVYFRRDDYDNSAKELDQAVANNPNADPTDLYVLGVDLENLKRSGEAAEIFGRCAAIQSSLQDRCKTSADLMKVASR
jgi:tetratricopeptide (TPR) repeat protein